MAIGLAGKVFVLLVGFSSVYCNRQKGFEAPPLKITQTVGQPWPAPKQMNSTSQVFVIDAGKFVFLDPKGCEILEEAFVRYQKLIFGSGPRGKREALKFQPWRALKSQKLKAGMVASLIVNVIKPCVTGEFPALESDESCKHLKTLMYKITCDLVAIPAADYLIPNTRHSRHNHLLAYRQIPTFKDYYKYTLFPRTIVHWNALPC